jgi:membrane protease YdiL (CAAX protease family)
MMANPHKNTNSHSLFFLLFLLFSGWFAATLLSLYVAQSFPDADKSIRFYWLLLSELIFAAPILIYLYRREKFSFKSFLLILPPPQIWKWLGLLIIGLIPLLDALDRIVIRFFPLPPEYNQYLSELAPDSLGSWIAAILSLGVIAALVEELLFRGILQKEVLNQTGSWRRALVFSVLTFAMIHAVPQLFIQIAAAAVILGLLALGFNSILPGIVFHFFNNLWSLFLLGYQEQSLSFYETDGLVRVPVIILSGIFVYFAVLGLQTDFTLPGAPFSRTDEGEEEDL